MWPAEGVLLEDGIVKCFSARTKEVLLEVGVGAPRGKQSCSDITPGTQSHLRMNRVPLRRKHRLPVLQAYLSGLQELNCEGSAGSSHPRKETPESATTKSPGGGKSKKVKCPKSHVIGKEDSRK